MVRPRVHLSDRHQRLLNVSKKSFFEDDRVDDLFTIWREGVNHNRTLYNLHIHRHGASGRTYNYIIIETTG